MKNPTSNLITLAILPASLLALTSCSSTPKGGSDASTVVASQPGVPGGVIVQTHTTVATVISIDRANRKITIVGKDAKKEEVKCGPEVVNFPQIQVGDQVKATVTEHLVVFMAADAPPQDEGALTKVALAPVGAKPGGMIADTVQVKAKLIAIDIKKNQGTLKFSDGSTKTVTARPDVDLTQRHVGEEVVIRYTESLAIIVEKP